jgi:hypothetical protein
MDRREGGAHKGKRTQKSLELSLYLVSAQLILFDSA